ncbi:uncharacterized protein ACHE_30690A [Aspergillus chevalieri]|uniref:Uncharacterized protein n=1 Tax=Aspergillus chevalieri TaxID=182096 RepID=A0A7R7ZLQ7_ASPCH|nr:uncharacterized protein ACHE_30690A [Aspergillus chevalieri]BCR86703.1 hypothetical protein ACHE_30690A [Aspergillus chevalieri]
MLPSGNQTSEIHGRGIINLKRSAKKFKIAQRFLGIGRETRGQEGWEFLSVTVVPFRRLRTLGPLAGKQATDEEAKKDSIAGKIHRHLLRTILSIVCRPPRVLGGGGLPSPDTALIVKTEELNN